jgi:hypothetical protein
MQVLLHATINSLKAQNPHQQKSKKILLSTAHSATLSPRNSSSPGISNYPALSSSTRTVGRP